MEYYDTFLHNQDYSAETATGSPLSGDATAWIDGPKPQKSKRIAGKRVVTVAIVDGDAYPPADSWTWRKYGQKPIKGSPYPRGYYRCTSSKGCPARKQVERNWKDPTKVHITYASEHNHLITTATKNSQPRTIHAQEDIAVFADQPELEPDNIDFAEFVADFGYFNNITSVILESPLTTSPICMEPDTAVIFSRGDDDSLFADLGELPECSLIFQQRDEQYFLHNPH